MSVKGDLRRAFRQRRRDKINRAAADAAIALRVLDSSAYGQARVLLGYAALPEEIQTDGILRRALAEGKALYLPRCLLRCTGAVFSRAPIQYGFRRSGSVLGAGTLL